MRCSRSSIGSAPRSPGSRGGARDSEPGGARRRGRDAARAVDSSDAGGYGARQVWLYATILTVGYMVSRGLAKSGSRDPYDDGSR
jgi:hypothetical protein